MDARRRTWGGWAVAAGLTVLLVLLTVAVVGPVAWWLVRTDAAELPAGQLGHLKDTRTLLIQAIGGLLVAGTLAVGVRTYLLTREGQLTTRFKEAIELLGSAQADVRVGGIFALERVGADSPKDRPTIAEILQTFLRTHAAATTPPGEETRPRSDVSAAARVLSRPVSPEPLRLAGIDLTGAYLPDAVLIGADLSGVRLVAADLSRGRLDNANLREARLDGCHLAGAGLRQAHLLRADLSDADLTRADLQAALLHQAVLRRAKLPEADLRQADLYHADLRRAQLAGADLRGAILIGADLRDADLTGATVGAADFTGARIDGAILYGVELGAAAALEPEQVATASTEPSLTPIVVTGRTGR